MEQHRIRALINHMPSSSAAWDNLMESYRGGEAASNAAAAAASLSGAPVSKAAGEACSAVPPAAASVGAAPLPTYSTETANRLPQEGTSSSSDCHNRSSSSVGHSCFSSQTAPACSRCLVLAAEARTAAAAAAAAARGGAGEAASPMPVAVVAPALPFTSTTVSLLQQGHGSSSSSRDQYNRNSSSCQISSSSSRAAVSSCTDTTGTSSTPARGDIQGDVLAETVSDMMRAAGLPLDLGKLLSLALDNQKKIRHQDDVRILDRERLKLEAERYSWEVERAQWEAERVMLISQMLELQAEIESKGAAWQCPVCISHEVDVVFTGCGHMFCSTCSSSLRGCAICRKDSRVQKLYRA